MNALDVNPELQNLLQPVVLEQEAPPVEEAADPAPVAEEPPKKSFDYNAAQLRKAKEEAEQEIYRLRRELEQARQHSQRGAQSDEDEDTIITLKEARKIAVEEARRVQHQNDSRFMEDRLRAKFPDFADVVTEESVARLRYEDPELAESINQNPDMHNKLVALYKVIKRSEPSPPPLRLNERQAEANLAKPKSVQSLGASSPIGSANTFEVSLTPELKEKLWKEMLEIRKRG